MTRCRYPDFSCLLLLVGLLAGPARALEVSPALLQRYGVELAQPVVDDAAVVAAGDGYVIAPPASERAVVAPVAGIIEAVLVATGDQVDTGTPLARISGPGLLELQREYLAATRAESRAQNQLERDVALHADGIISDRRLQESRDEFATAGVSRAQLAMQLDLIGIDLPARSHLAESGQPQTTTRLLAPQTGTVVAINMHPGESLTTDQAVARIVDLRQLWLELQVSRADARQIRHGHVARLPDGPRIGTVIGIAPIIDPATQTALVRVALDPDVPLALGAFTRVQLLAPAEPGVLLTRIPASAIVRGDDGVSLFIVDGAQLRLQPVTLVGATQGDAWVNGVSGHDRIVIRGTAALRAWYEEADESGTGAPAGGADARTDDPAEAQP